MRCYCCLVFLLITFSSFAQKQQHREVAVRFQDSLNTVYTQPETSILSKKQLEDFNGLDFWEYNEKYHVKAKFEPALIPLPIKMATSTGEPRLYRTYGAVFFTIDSKEYKLTVYQNPQFLTPHHPHKNQLLLGFTDGTSGDGSYAGGRFVPLLVTNIHRDDSVFIDFNMAYNPYCAYTEGYSCAIPPKENDLSTRIEAGVRDYVK